MLKYRQSGIQTDSPATEVGAGLQSAIVVGIFRTYEEMNERGPFSRLRNQRSSYTRKRLAISKPCCNESPKAETKFFSAPIHLCSSGFTSPNLSL